MPSSPPLPSREDGCLAVGRGQHVAPTCPPAGLHMTDTRKTSCQGQAPSMQAPPPGNCEVGGEACPLDTPYSKLPAGLDRWPLSGL